jgi:hypothetical protein
VGRARATDDRALSEVVALAQRFSIDEDTVITRELAYELADAVNALDR